MSKLFTSTLLFSFLFLNGYALQTYAADKKPNVLFIAIDDLNDWVGCLKGHPQIKTPHLDAVAKRGVLFSNAHCQAPLCNPSRTSMLLGLRPSTTGIYGLRPMFRSVPELENRVTLPNMMTSAGYYSYTVGKIYHGYAGGPKLKSQEFEKWDTHKRTPRRAKTFAVLPNQHPLMDWGPHPQRDEDHMDYDIATHAANAVQNAPTDRPFFIACGFHLPHVPCYAPPKWFELYPNDQLKLPPVLPDDRKDTPEFSWYLHFKLPEPRLSLLQKLNEWKPLVRGYLASVSFMDAQVGRVVEALKKTDRLENTIIVVWSDHGYHLGEKAISGKNTLWERSARVPLIFAGPGITQGGECKQPVELLDVYPTLAELCALKAPKDLEGHSLIPQLKDPLAKRNHPAITTHNQGNHSIRDERWRYIHYADGSEELYDYTVDPNEWHNLASFEEYSDIKQKLKRWLPKKDVPMVFGSKHRTLSYDPQTKKVVWEGKEIIPGSVEK